MSAPKEIQDCYFFYYSTCRKGDRCPYRHEQAALGHEVVCQKWREGQCFDVKCGYRHMVIEKLRRDIPCYWETKPSGCQKPHCVFKHTAPRPADTPDASAAAAVNGATGEPKADSTTEPAPAVDGGAIQSDAVPKDGQGDGAQPEKVTSSGVVPSELNNNNEGGDSKPAPAESVAAAPAPAAAPAAAVEQ